LPAAAGKGMGMLDRIRSFLDRLASNDGPRTGIGEDEVKVAVAALLHHVIAVDGAVSPQERTLLTELLKTRFDLDPAETRSLADAGERADADAVDLYSFTSVLKRRLDVEDRERIIEMMWRLVYADGGVHEFEDNVVWRVAELLAVPTQVRIRLKQATRGGVD
jgi:uncharacterized tellurite resistance protein B-like protein